jgi:cyclopropane fatty-acyl-phospholipid synthase-like methyltransferase
MVEYQGTQGFYGSWEETYRQTPPGDLPWNAGMADGDLKDLVETLALEPGKAYDLGCGPGHDAAYLAGLGWKVTAVDISPTAVQLAREAAAKSGTEGNIQFVTADVLTLQGRGDAALVNDRGCFHTLPRGKWADYVRLVSGLLMKNGLLALKVFSFKEPKQTAGPGPYRFTEEELEEVFEEAFEMVMLKEGIFHGPRKPYSFFGVFRKK